MTLQQKYITSLIRRGSTFVKATKHYKVYTRLDFGRQTSTFYFISKGGALRIGTNINMSWPAPVKFKQLLLDDYTSV